jgi:hypothetical protein
MNSEQPLPKPHEVIRTPLPDSMDGIRFEIARISKYIMDGCKDPLVIATAQKIAEISIGTARQLKRKITEGTRKLIVLKGIHAWCHANFEHVSNPAGAEVIKTPARMFRELDIPEEFARAIWEPIRDSMARNPEKLTLPKPKITGSCGVAVCLLLTLAAAVGITPMRMRLGGHTGTVHYVWGNVHANGRWHDVDILLAKFGKHEEFPLYELVEVPV